MHIYLSYKIRICLGQDRDFIHNIQLSVQLLAMGIVQLSTSFSASSLATGRRECASGFVVQVFSHFLLSFLGNAVVIQLTSCTFVRCERLNLQMLW